MKRLTFEGLFCDIAKCDSTPGGTFCESGTCTQRRVWEQLKEYEDTGLEPEDIMAAVTPDALIKLASQMLGVQPEHLRELVQAERDGRLVVPCKVGDSIYIPDLEKKIPVMAEQWAGPVNEAALKGGEG